jgi:hypothetical protein
VGSEVSGNGTGFVWYYAFAEQGKVVQGALVDAVEAGFVTMEQVQLGGGGQFGEGVGDAGGLAIGGGEALDMLGEEVVKALSGFVFQDHAPGQETVAEGVSGGAFFPLRGDGTSGAGRVGTGRVDSSE